MAKRLFSFHPDDGVKEVEFVGERLKQQSIEYYETPGSTFGFSKPTLWIKHDTDFSQAKQIFLDGQHEYAKLAREQYQAETGYNPNAPLNEKIIFHLNFLYHKRKILPFIILGFILLYLYFSLFLSAFGDNNG